MKRAAGMGFFCGLLAAVCGCGPEQWPASGPAARGPEALPPVQSRPALTAEMLRMHRRPWDAETWGPQPEQPGDAAEDYVKAMAEYNRNAKSIHDGIDAAKDPAKLDAAVVGLLKGVQTHIAAATQKKEMRFTFVYTPKSFEVSPEYAPIKELDDDLMRLLYVLAVYHVAKGEFPAAQEAMKQMYTFYWHSAQDGSRVTMVVGGEKLGLWATYLLAKEVFARWDEQHVRQAGRINEKLKQQVQAGDDKFQRVWGPNPSPADIFAIIAYDEDRAWRIDAILALGMLKFSHASDGQVAMKVADLIERYSVSEDPLESAAAKAAKEFTREQFDKIQAAPAGRK
ncbi:MAG: hypothetical protein HZA50_08110 [Planctomycetes bacterium]|nr:hypothetical protein [Planctomycetota bacterium]